MFKAWGMKINQLINQELETTLHLGHEKTRQLCNNQCLQKKTGLNMTECEGFVPVFDGSCPQHDTSTMGALNVLLPSNKARERINEEKNTKQTRDRC